MTVEKVNKLLASGTEKSYITARFHPKNPGAKMAKNSFGLCACGCGNATPLAAYTDKRRGTRKGQPLRYIQGHHLYGERSPSWKGGKNISPDGYVRLRTHDTPDGKSGLIFEHVVVAERALGKPLPKGAVIHHVDGNPANNDPRNLVVCDNQAYHVLLHMRQRAHDACGNANARLCKFCGQHDDPTGMYVRPNGSGAYHRECKRAYDRARYAQRQVA